MMRSRIGNLKYDLTHHFIRLLFSFLLSFGLPFNAPSQEAKWVVKQIFIISFLRFSLVLLYCCKRADSVSFHTSINKLFCMNCWVWKDYNFLWDIKLLTEINHEIFLFLLLLTSSFFFSLLLFSLLCIFFLRMEKSKHIKRHTKLMRGELLTEYNQLKS